MTTPRTAEAAETCALFHREIEGAVGAEFMRRKDVVPYVVGPTIEFILALVAWEADGTDQAREQLGRCYDNVWVAWQRALNHLPEEEPIP